MSYQDKLDKKVEKMIDEIIYDGDFDEVEDDGSDLIFIKHSTGYSESETLYVDYESLQERAIEELEDEGIEYEDE